jgi:hypothetical protein
MDTDTDKDRNIDKDRDRNTDSNTDHLNVKNSSKLRLYLARHQSPVNKFLPDISPS